MLAADQKIANSSSPSPSHSSLTSNSHSGPHSDKSDQRLDVAWVRSQFPALSQTVRTMSGDTPAFFFDGPGGTQVPQRVLDAMSGYLANNNANTGGAYATSRNTDSMIADARAAMGDFLNCDADEIVFGANMTTLTFAMSRALGRDLVAGDEILLTLLDHDANFSPWKALEEKGVVIRTAKLKEEDCTLDMQDLASKISDRTRIVAVGYASNAVGTINDVAEIVRLARQAGALSYIDAVHYAPHGAIDVRALDCDFLVCSTYKFFGPHMGVLFGKHEHLKKYRPYKVRPNSDNIPNCWEWGTLNHECIAGIKACIDYWEELGNRVGGRAASVLQEGKAPGGSARRQAILSAQRAIHAHEREMMEKMIAGLLTIPRLKLYGIKDPSGFEKRCATFVVRIEGHTPLELATKLGERGFFTWDGNYYALNLTEQLGVEASGGFLRIGLVHYNTTEEVERLLQALREIGR